MNSTVSNVTTQVSLLSGNKLLLCKIYWSLDTNPAVKNWIQARGLAAGGANSWAVEVILIWLQEDSEVSQCSSNSPWLREKAEAFLGSRKAGISEYPWLTGFSHAFRAVVEYSGPRIPGQILKTVFRWTLKGVLCFCICKWKQNCYLELSFRNACQGHELCYGKVRSDFFKLCSLKFCRIWPLPWSPHRTTCHRRDS